LALAVDADVVHRKGGHVMLQEIPPSLDLQEVGGVDWDVVVVGAGPAGAMSAVLLAQRGRRVLLVDHARFPRDKVCGCCINPVAMGVLEAAGLRGLLERAGAVTLRSVRLAVGRISVDIPLPGGAALSRRTLDAAMVRAAMERGAAFLPGTSARLSNPADAGRRAVLLRSGGKIATVGARVVLACDGLPGRLLDQEPDAEWIIDRQGRIGVATILPTGSASCEPGRIYMAVGNGGYVGLVRLEDGRVDLAAALDGGQCRQVGGPGKLVERILADSGFVQVQGCGGAHYQGTPLLTRRRRTPGAWRVLAVGDACGYVEPFTGEGIGWAMVSAAAVVGVVERGIGGWSEELVGEWTGVGRRLLGRRRAVCWAVTRALRWRRLAQAMVRLARSVPGWAVPTLLLCTLIVKNCS